MVPFINANDEFELGDYILIKNIREYIASGKKDVEATLIRNNEKNTITLSLDQLTDDEKQIILDGCLINYYGNGR